MVRVLYTLVQSGWWSMASHSKAIRAMAAKASLKSLNLKVFVMLLFPWVQPLSSPREDSICCLSIFSIVFTFCEVNEFPWNDPLGLCLDLVVQDLLIADTQIFGKLVVPGQGGQVPILVGGVHPFEDGVVIAHALDQFLDELLMLDQIAAAQMEDARQVPVDQVMDLLGQPVVVGHVDDQVWEDLDSLVAVQLGLYFPDSGGIVPKDHRDS